MCECALVEGLGGVDKDECALVEGWGGVDKDECAYPAGLVRPGPAGVWGTPTQRWSSTTRPTTSPTSTSSSPRRCVSAGFAVFPSATSCGEAVGIVCCSLVTLWESQVQRRIWPTL